MHIIGGLYHLRSLASPKGQEVRPTSSRLREALFNICQGYIQEARFLDLFAGSGAMGLEALSRGAKHATFIDNSRESIRCIEGNITSLNLETQTRVLYGDVFTWITKLQHEGRQFDIIFADPPYQQFKHAKDDLLSFGERVLHAIDASSLLTKDGVLFIEESKIGMNETSALHTLKLRGARKMGRSVLHQYLKI